jgi:hypothetical protein
MVVTERSSEKLRVYWHDSDGALFDVWVPTIAVKVRA